MRRYFIVAITLLVAFTAAPVAAGPVLGMTDTFETGSDGWFTGGGPAGVPITPVPVVPTGGPGGLGDSYLLLSAVGGAGASSRLVANNAAQWAGDWTGIPRIEMDVLNLSGIDLTLRLLLENPIPGPPTDVAITTAGAFVPSGSGWTHISLAVDAANLTVLDGSLNNLLSNVTFIRLLHNPVAGFPPPEVVAELGVDNITAVPEPATLMLLTGGVAAAALRRRTRRT